MRTLWSFIKNLFFAAKVITIAVAAPVISLVKTTLEAKPVSLGQLLYAFWRLFVWLFFILTSTMAIGVPPIIATLFLIDLVVVGVHIVGVTVMEINGEPA